MFPQLSSCPVIHSSFLRDQLFQLQVMGRGRQKMTSFPGACWRSMFGKQHLHKLIDEDSSCAGQAFSLVVKMLAFHVGVPGLFALPWILTWVSPSLWTLGGIGDGSSHWVPAITAYRIGHGGHWGKWTNRWELPVCLSASQINRNVFKNSLKQQKLLLLYYPMSCYHYNEWGEYWKLSIMYLLCDIACVTIYTLQQRWKHI